MEHVVFFPAPDGTPAFRRVANLADAVRLVEHLRNLEGVNEVSVHALDEVPLSFRTVFKVELPSLAGDVPIQVETAPDPRAASEPMEEEVPSLVSDAVVLEVVPDLVHDLVPDPVSELVPDQVAAVALEQAPVEQPEPVLIADNGHTPDRARSLGFFT